MDFNTILSINQTFHNIGAVLFAAGPFYILLILSKRRGLREEFLLPDDLEVEETFSFAVTLWLFVLVAQGATGATFALISIGYEGELPQIAPVAMVALTIKVVGAAAAFFISLYLRLSLVGRLKSFAGRLMDGQRPSASDLALYSRLRARRERLVWILLVLAGIIITGAAFLRWNV